MKKSLFIMMLAIAGVALPSFAQQTLKVPFFKEFVKVKEGTIFRKAPNATSEKLVEECEGECWFQWSQSGENAYVTYVALNGENGNWYDVYVSDEWHGSENAYINKNSATKVQTIALAMPASDQYHIVQVSSGKYKDWYIQFLEEGMDTEPRLAFGVPIEGKILMLKQIRIYNSGGNTNKLEDVDDSYFKEYYGNIAFNFTNEFGNTFEFNLDKLAANNKVVEMLLDNFHNYKDYTALFFGVTEDKEWHCIPINKYNFKGNLFELK